MDKEDKILITAYLDGETSEAESHHVEDLLTKDKDALEYVNNLKKANNTLDSFFLSQDMNILESNINEFIKSKTNKKNILTDNLKSFFNPFSITGYAAVALVSFLIISPSDFSLEYSLSNFSNETIDLEYNKYRGGEVSNSDKTIIQQSLKEMIQSQSLSARVIYGSDTYFIKLVKTSFTKDDIRCFNGKILSNGQSKDFYYCQTENDDSLTFIN